MSGRIVLAQKITHQEPIDISFLPKGVYGYRLMGWNGELIDMGRVLKEYKRCQKQMTTRRNFSGG